MAWPLWRAYGKGRELPQGLRTLETRAQLENGASESGGSEDGQAGPSHGGPSGPGRQVGDELSLNAPEVLGRAQSPVKGAKVKDTAPVLTPVKGGVALDPLGALLS